MPKYERQPEQLCASCMNAVPSERTGHGCEWSRDLKPVPGWDAEMVVKGGYGVTWSVKGCPKFEAEPPRGGKSY